MMKRDENLKALRSDLRTIAGLALTFASLVALLMLASCAPKPVARVYPVPKMDFGPLQKDPILSPDQLRASSVDSSDLKWHETVDSARIFRFAESMLVLGKLKGSPALLKLGQKVGNAFYNAHGAATRTDLDQSLYITAATGETKASVMPMLDKNDTMLASQLVLVHSLLKETAENYQWPSPETPPRIALSAAKSYAKDFLSRAADSEMNAEVYDGIVSAFKTDFYPLIDGFAGEINSILDETSSIVMIDRLKGVIKKYQFGLDPGTADMIDRARAIFVAIDAIDTSQDALTVIVELWEMTAPESRQKTFEPVSKQLYDFLKNKGPGDLACIKSSGCLNPLIFLPKQIGVLPAIEKYGIEKLKVDIDAAAHATLVKQISGAVASFVPSIPGVIDQKITTQLTQIRTTIASVKSDYPGFIRGIVREYETQNMDAPKNTVIRIPGLESTRVNISLAPGVIEIAQGSNASVASSGSEVIGDSMAYAVSLWDVANASSTSYQKSIISQVDKLFALGGFQTPDKKPYPSLSISLDPQSADKHLNIHDTLNIDVPFAVPDAFQIGPSLTPKFASGGKNVSVRGQAELLRGLAAATRYFRDWEKNGFDTSLGSVEVGGLIKDLPAGSVTTKLFPKDSFFALSVANAATILKNMTKPLSPVFLIDITRRSMWANDRSDDVDQPATMAALVDIVSGQRTTTVQTADAARFLLAIADFLDATADIEKTQAAPLLKKDADGTRPIDQLIEARSSLTMLIVGIGNFISHEMQASDGGIRAGFRQDLLTVNTKEPRRAIDQAVCILALVKAGEVLGKDIYIWPALDAYAFMNKTLFDAKKGFYRSAEDSDTVPAPDEIAMILQAGETLRAHMSLASRDQWDMLSTPWVKALEGLN